ncbi:MAG: hypothetical protein PUD16_01045 [bacterium]|nr:hypothetical protein [bacterium]
MAKVNISCSAFAGKHIIQPFRRPRQHLFAGIMSSAEKRSFCTQAEYTIKRYGIPMAGV